MKLDKVWSRHFVLLIFACLGLSLPASAYFSTADTADLVASQRYKLGIAPQFIVTERDGANIVARADTGISDDSSIRALFGFGSVDIQVGGFYKWAPVPDIEGQPAMALMGGVLFASDSGGGELSLRLHPIISKKFPTASVLFNPYFSLPIGLTAVDGDTLFPIQAAIGLEFRVEDLKTVQFLAETGINLNDSFSYITIGASILLDDSGSWVNFD